MNRIRRLLPLVLAAGCASAPVREPLQKRDAVPGREIMDDLLLVSLRTGSPGEVVVRNLRGEPRRILWTARFRSPEGYEIRSAHGAVREVLIPGGGEARLPLNPPTPDATQVELILGDR